MAAAVLAQDIGAVFKRVYSDNIEKLIPKGIKFIRDIKFVPRNKMPGNSYHQPVCLQHEHGVTYEISDADNFTLENPIAGVYKDATIVGAQLALRSHMGIEAAARAQRGGDQAFESATRLMVENMTDSGTKRLEISCIYGREGIGQVSSINDTTKVMVIKKATWAPGIWAGLEGAAVAVWSTTAATATERTGPFKVVSVDMDTRSVTLDVTTSNIAANDHVYFKTSRTSTGYKEQVGIDRLAFNPGATVFGVNTTFSLWKAPTFDVGSTTLKFAHVNNAVAQLVGKGQDNDLRLYLNPEVWADLINDEAAQRRHVRGSERMYTVGAEGIEFHSQNGSITIIASNYVKTGRAYLMSLRDWARVGSWEMSFRIPGRGDEFFTLVPDKMSYELRLYSNQAVFTRALGRSLLGFKNIIS